MVRITANEKSLLFTFTNSNHYFQNGTVEVPKNSLALIVDDSDMASFKKSASNDLFISANYTELGMSKSELVEWFKENGFSEGGSGGGLTPEEAQEMIDESISGKADTTAMTEALTAKLDVSSFNTYSGNVNTAITSIESDITDVQTALQGKASQSDLTALETVVGTKASETDLQALESVVGGKLNTSDFNTYSANVNTELASKASNADLNTLSGVVDTKADKTEIPDVSNYIDNVDYDSTNHLIKFFHNQTLIDSVDATDFIKDGMVSNVEIVNGKLVISFNTDAGKEDIEIPLTDIFNPNNYYDKTATDALLDAKLNVSDFNTYSSATQTAIQGKANASDLQALEVVVGTKANATDLDSLANTVNGKVDVSAYTAYTSATDATISTKASQSDLNTVSGIVDSKLNTSDFNTYSGGVDTTITSIQGDITDVQTALNGKASQTDLNAVSGAVDTKLNISDFNTYSGNVNTALSNKADISSLANYVETTAYTAYTSATDTVLSGKASQTDLNTVSGNVDTLSGQVANKADTTAMTTALADKLDISTFETYSGSVDTALSGKASQTDLNTVSGNVDTLSGDMANKVDVSTYTAYTSATDTALQGKVDTSDLANYVEVTAYTAYTSATDTALSGKASQTDLNTVSGSVANKQDLLVSGTNIKTVNNTSLLGSGNITIEGGQTVTSITQAQYDSLTTKDPDTFYIISDATGGTITIDPSLNSGSTNAVANSAITIAIDTVSAATASNTTSINTINTQLGGYKLWKGTQAQYDAIVTKDEDTIYFIVNNS